MAKDQVTVDQYALPDAKTLQEARDLPLLDGDGNKTTFGAITTPKEGTPRQLVVFIRHFFCGVRSLFVKSTKRPRLTSF